jgi:hypothetical protein
VSEWECPSFVEGHCGDLECFDCGTLRHELHAGDPGYEDCLACKLQTIQLSPAIRRLSGDPHEVRDRPSAAPKRFDNAWERGIARDERGVPYLNEKGDEIGVKQFAEKRHVYEKRIRDLKNRPAPSATPS